MAAKYSCIMCTKYFTSRRHWKRVFPSLCLNELLVPDGSHWARERQPARSQAGECAGKMPKFLRKWMVSHPLNSQCHTELASGDLASSPAPTPAIWDLRHILFYVSSENEGVSFHSKLPMIYYDHFCIVVSFVFQFKSQKEKQLGWHGDL